MRFGRVARARAVVATGTAVLVTAGIAAASDVSDEVINACVKENGQVRIAGSAADCGENETALTWSERGPAGPAGPKGEDGAAGPAGPKGDPGMVVRDYTVARDESVRIPLLGGDGELILNGPDLCQYDYRNAGSANQVVYGQDNAPTTVYAGSTVMVGRGYPAGNPGRERAVFDQGSPRTAKFEVAGYNVPSVPGASGSGCRFQVLLAE